MNQSAATPQRASRREWIGLAVIALPCMLYSMDLTVLNLAVPALSADLKPSSAQLLWIVDIYGFLVAGSLITMGTLGDRIGRRRLLLIGAAAFGLASVLAAFANSAETLIAARAILGVAGATLAPSTLSLIRNMFLDPRQRSIAIGVWIASFSAGGAIGPLLGGVVLAYFWWGAVFLLAVPVMLLLLVLGPLLLPEFRDPQAGRLDLPSAGLSLAAVLSMIYGIKRLAEGGWDWLPLLFIAAGLILGTLFVRRQRTLADPLIDLSLFRSPAFSAALAINILGFFAMFSAFLYMAQYLQLVLGMGPMEAGGWTVPSALAFIVGSSVVPIVGHRLRPAYVIAGGLALSALGFVVLSQVSTSSALAVLVIGSIIFSLGLTPVVSLTTDLLVGSAPPERAGAAAALSETSSELGGALGIAVLGSVATAVYRHHMLDAVPQGLPAGVSKAAWDTVGGAVAMAHDLPGELGTALLAAAREAFVQGLQLSATLSAIVLMAACLVALLALRQAKVGGH
ncbi:MFS transporter [Polaromonas sp. SM01]|uniref:MFS transporter n=1 Tax=Polaromonas sp. SM01 TaxID=3085630 RepID=UPI002981C852|nr:MFS transporter [Polaromonas sp. SM01]MDW5443008.1 MFS transporter [Polaromonas sp. SM01]